MKKLTITALILTLLFVLRAIPNQPPVAEAKVASQSSLEAGTAADSTTTEPALIAPEIQTAIQSLQTDEMISVIVTLKEQVDLTKIGGPDRATRQEGLIKALQAMANASQKRLITLLTVRQAQGKVSQFSSFWVFNGLEVTATSEVIQELTLRSEVLKITPNGKVSAPVVPATNGSPEPNLTVVDAPALWNLGFRGQGIVVASMDTGVDVNHPDLSAQWRGGSNSWFDPNGQHPTTPADLSGHGTWTMGVMVGRDAGGTSIGVAPEAQWIAVKIFNDSGSATVAGIHAGFQWLLDPDGNSATPDAPHVVNNSWSFGNPGCNLEFQLDVQAWQAAGIVPIFAAGNYGPGSSTSVSPANYPESFAVGATDNSDAIYAYSSRGPSACGETATIYPELMAPGVNIKSSGLYGSYTTATGTSLAAPHVAGGLALLLSAYPNLTVAEQEAALLNSGVDLGQTGSDNNFGYGRLNLLAAYQSLAGGGSDPTPTPIPTNTPTPTPTNTPVPSPQAPSNLTTGRTTKSTIDLNWQDNAGDEQGFYIQRSTDGGASWSQVGTTGSNVTSYTDEGLSRKTTYWYRVQAYNASGLSAFSNTASAKTK